MIEDVTENLRSHYSDDLRTAIDGLASSEFFGRETLSAAVGEISEVLIARATGASRIKRGNPGYDLVLGETLIEVKSRFISTWDEQLKFDFRPNTIQATFAYCVVWKDDEGRSPELKEAFRLSVPFLISRWAPAKSDKHCARTNLKKLRLALAEQADTLKTAVAHADGNAVLTQE